MNVDYLQYQRSIREANGNRIAVFRDRVTKKIYLFICEPFFYAHRQIRVWDAYLIVDRKTPCLLSMDDAKTLLKKAKNHCPTVFNDIVISFISEKSALREEKSMLEKIKVSCEMCIHKDVCSHKKNFEAVASAVSNTTVNEHHDNRTVMVPLENYEFVDDIHISCKFFKPAAPMKAAWPRKERYLDITLNDYQKLASRSLHEILFDIEQELGTLCDVTGKFCTKKEVGDLLWMIAEYCTVNNWSLDEIAKMNIDKLKARYPDGFEAARSLN